jgi:hypothetical protein
VLFEKRLRDGLADGTVTLALRRWRRPQVVAGGVYRTGGDGPRVRVVAVDVVAPQDLTPDDATAAGYASPVALLGAVRGDADLPLYRLRFAVEAGEDPRTALGRSADLGPDDVAGLLRRLARMDASAGGPWTADVLRLVAAHPGVVSTDLAPRVGREGLERQEFKLRVRRLKALGLTESLTVGYRLTPRGQALLEHLPAR